MPKGSSSPEPASPRRLMAIDPRAVFRRTSWRIPVSISGANWMSYARDFTSSPRWLRERISTPTVRRPSVAFARPNPVMLTTSLLMLVSHRTQYHARIRHRQWQRRFSKSESIIAQSLRAPRIARSVARKGQAGKPGAGFRVQEKGFHSRSRNLNTQRRRDPFALRIEPAACPPDSTTLRFHAETGKRHGIGRRGGIATRTGPMCRPPS